MLIAHVLTASPLLTVETRWIGHRGVRAWGHNGKKVRLSFPVNPVLLSPEAEWAAEAFRPRSAREAASWDSISPDWEGAACTARWDVPVRVGDDFVPGGLSREFPFWRDVLLIDHPDRNTILTSVRDGVSVYEFLLPDARGVSVEKPFIRSFSHGRRCSTEYQRSSVSLSRGKSPPS